MPRRSDRPELIVLRGGHVVSLAALHVAWKYEDKGIVLSRDTEEPDKLHIEPSDGLTEAHLAELRQFKGELLALIDYCASDLWQPSRPSEAADMPEGSCSHRSGRR